MLLMNEPQNTQMQENVISVDDLGKVNLGEGPKMRAYFHLACGQRVGGCSKWLRM